MTVVAITHRTYAGDTVDKYGAPAVPATSTETVAGALVAPAEAADLTDPTRDGRSVEFDIYLPFATVVGPHDSIALDGVPYEIHGQAKPWVDDRSGWQAGRVVRVWRVIG